MTRDDPAIFDTDAWWGHEARHLRALRHLVEPRMRYFGSKVTWHGKQVVDLGCGGGFMAEAITRCGARVIGVDPSPRALEAARRHAAALALSIDYRLGWGEDLPVDTASADVVVCTDVLEHVGDLPRVVAEVARALRPGGAFLFDTINRGWLATLVVVVMGERILRMLPRGTHDPQKFIRPSHLAQLLGEEGMVMEEVVGFGPRGLTGKMEVTFGTLPTTAVMYMGHAQRAEVDRAPRSFSRPSRLR